jgi:hypothetical protein
LPESLKSRRLPAGTNDDLAGLLAFLERTPDFKAALLVYNGKEAIKIGDLLYAIPMGTALP